MALTQLHWKKFSYATGGVTGIEDTLNAIYDALDSVTTYHDATTRTPGSGSAWTVARYQNTGVTEAVYMTPPAAAVSDLRVIVAGAAGAATPTMNPYDSYTASRLLVGINKNSGAFNAWDNAAPFTSGSFSGYSKDVAATSYTFDTIYVFESEEAILVTLESSANTVFAFIGGCWIDPGSTDPLDAESNGRLYAVCNGGTFGEINVELDSTTGFFTNSASDGGGHVGVFQPNASNLIAIDAQQFTSSLMGTDSFKTPSGAQMSLPVHFHMYTLNWAVGFARGIYFSSNALHSTTVSQGGTEKGHHLFESTITLGTDGTYFFRSN